MIREDITKYFHGIAHGLGHELVENYDSLSTEGKYFYRRKADKIINLIVDKLTVIGIKLNRGGILSDVEVEYYNRGAEAQLEHAIKEIKGE